MLSRGGVGCNSAGPGCAETCVPSCPCLCDSWVCDTWTATRGAPASRCGRPGMGGGADPGPRRRCRSRAVPLGGRRGARDQEAVNRRAGLLF